MDPRIQQAELLKQVQQGMLQGALAEEQELDQKLAAMEELGEDDFERLRQKRKLDMQARLRKEQDWKQLGHGRYMEMTDTKEFFNAAKKSAKMVVHFYRSVTPRCQIVDAHFEKLAPKQLECRFVKIDAEKNPFLVERLQIVVMPTIVLIKEGKTDHSIMGFDELGGTDDFSTDDMGFVLAAHGMIDFQVDRSEELNEKMSNKMGLNAIRMSRIRSGGYDDMSDDED